MLANNRHKLLRLIANDPGSTEVERTEARRALAQMNEEQPAPSHRRGRNSNLPMSQADIDSDLEQELTFRSNDGLTTGDRVEITRGLDQSTRQILDAIQNNVLLWLFTSNSTDVPVLIDIVGKTGSALVRTKALDALRLVAAKSPIESAKIAAQTFLNSTRPGE